MSVCHVELGGPTYEAHCFNETWHQEEQPLLSVLMFCLPSQHVLKNHVCFLFFFLGGGQIRSDSCFLLLSLHNKTVGSAYPFSKKHQEASYAAEQLAKSSKSYVIVAACALEEPTAPKLLARLVELPQVRGIRQILNHQPDWPRNARLGDLLENVQWRQGFSTLQLDL